MASKKSTPKFDPKLYAKRLGALYDDWKNPESQDVWKNIGALVVANGTPDEEIIYKKSTALQDWLFGFELENTVMVFTERGVHILTPKADLLTGIVDARPADRPELSTTLYPVEAGDNAQSFDRLLLTIRGSLEGSVGALPREAALGDFIASWKKAFDEAGFTVANAANAIGNLFSTKDEQEQKFVRTAGAISAAVLKNFVVPEIETVVDEEKKVTHSAMAEKVDDIFLTPSKINPKLTADLVESCYTPIIQSGGVYDLKPSAVSNDDQLHFGTIICSLGARYRHYCSNVARTYFVDPDKEQEDVYALLLEVHKLMIKALVPGNPVKKIMEVAIEHIQKKKPELVPHFVKTGGFGMGLEFRESALSITNKNAKAIKEGMVFNISPGFHNLERKGDVTDPRKRVYSMMIADTVVVPAAGEPKPLTANAPSAWDDISYSVGDDDQEDEEAEAKPAAKSGGGRDKGKERKDAGRASTRALRDDDAAAFGMRTTRARDADKNKRDMAAELRRKKHQEELEQKKREEAAARFSSKSGKGDDGGREGAQAKEVMAYRSATEFPPEARNGRIHVDHKREAVLLPIYGMLVPFHISTIKNATKSEDYLRINFITPGSTLPNDKLPKVWKDGKATFIREMSFRCSDAKALATSLRLINELRKRASLRAHDTHVRDSLVAQEELVLSKVRPISLPDLYIRPTLGGRRSTGTLELHKNGFRFRSSKGGNVDILFKNIKHAFFQPAENEVITILHFHLWHPIMVGKKKASDIQVYSEVMEIAQALDGRMPRGMEREDYDDENHEREQRAKMNADFQNFTKKVEDLVPDLEFDIPYRELGFFGVPGRTNTFLMPTVHCLVQLVEPPFFVLTLDEVDIAHFERVQFSLKNFDLVFVYKDLTRQPAFISAIPVQNLEPIKDWLDECNIKYYEGPANLNWKTILSTIREDPKKFWEDGGWNFLNTEGGSDDEASESEEEDAYNPSDQSDEEAAASDSDAYSGSEEEDEDVSDDGEDEDDGEDSEEEGLDWDELEKRAAEEDKRVKYDDDVPRSKKRRRDDYSDDDDDDEDARPKRPSAAAPARRAAGGASGARPGAGGGARPSASSARPSSAGARASSSSSAGGSRGAAPARKTAPSDPKRRRLGP